MNKLTSKTRKALLTAGLLSGAALSSIVFSAPANAACGGGQLVVLKTVGTISCGDKNYIFDTIMSPYSGFADTDTYSILQTGGIHTLSVSAGLTNWTAANSPFKLNYSVVTTGSEFITAFNSAITTPDTTATGNYTVFETNGTPQNAVASAPSMTSPLSVTPLLSAATFSTTLTVNSGFVTQVTSSIRQGFPRSEVPGPLPLLGAGAAFGFSRRIRNRIKAAA
jgi:hypothetical protein